MIKNSKGFGLVLFGVIYIAAYIIGSALGALTDLFLYKMLIFDLTATVFIWLVSLLLHNSSLYDAYWSLTPMIMITYAITQFYENLNLFHLVLIIAFMIWSIRLTTNWVITFENLSWEDWRYRKYRELPKPLWHLANFFGIMMIPTFFVFAGMIPLFYFLQLNANVLSLLGSAVILGGTALEFFADRQMHSYLRNTTEKKTCCNGLWKYSRHPNYLGEILIWVGAYLALICTDVSYWYMCVGVFLMIFLFIVISIPLAEKRQLSRREDYTEYRERTSKLLLLPPK